MSDDLRDYLQTILDEGHDVPARAFFEGRESVAEEVLERLPEYIHHVQAETRVATLTEVSNGVRIFDPMLADRIKEIIATEQADALASSTASECVCVKGLIDGEPGLILNSYCPIHSRAVAPLQERLRRCCTLWVSTSVKVISPTRCGTCGRHLVVRDSQWGYYVPAEQKKCLCGTSRGLRCPVHKPYGTNTANFFDPVERQ